jgi:uncharacterized protein YdiU (UPF0061 family)
MAILETVPERVSHYWLAGFRAKLGLTTAAEGDAELVNGLLQAMHAAEADFTLTFRQLAAVADGQTPELGGLPPGLAPWIAEWQARLAREREPGHEPNADAPQRRAAAMLATNPLFIPRNHRVEEAIRAAEDEDDFAPFLRLLEVVINPWDYVISRLPYGLPAAPAERVTRTFCGT